MLFRSHLLIAVAVGSIGCGRIAFDAVESATDGGSSDGPAPDLVVDETPDDLTVTVPGRFTLRFAQNRDWFAVDWRDATAPDELLVPPAGDLDKTVLLGVMIEMPLADFGGTGSGTDRAMMVVEKDTTHVVFRTAFDVTSGADVVQVETVNEIDRDGLWKITLTIDRLAGATMMDTLEYADSHVNDALAWTQTLAPNSYRWRREGAGLRATMQVNGPNTSGTAASDELNNLYFSESALAMPVSRGWEVVIWPPT